MKDVFVYQIDQNDTIVKVSENWEAFAIENGWGNESSPGKGLGFLLWDYIHDLETRHLYRELFKRVRAGNRVGPIPFRCDSPRIRRFMELLISPLSDAGIEITSTIIRSEFRDPVTLLDSNKPKFGELIRMCSMCKKVDTSRGEWVELEEWLVRLRPFEEDKLPGLTHSMCLACFALAMADLD